MKITERAYKWAYPLMNRLRTNLCVWHHSASGTSTTPDDIHAWHLKRGWAGIAYNFVVLPSGEIVRGRPEGKVGGHTKGHNSRSLGVCVVGNFQTKAPTPAQIKACQDLKAYIDGRYNVTHRRHKDLAPTACPGTYFPWPIGAAAPVKPKPSQSMPLIRRGSKGGAVKTCQAALNAKNNARLRVDGDFGAKTERAVKAYQKRCRMKVDGIVGPKTWAALGYR